MANRFVIRGVTIAAALSYSMGHATDAPMLNGWDATLRTITHGQAVIKQTFPGPEGLTGLVISHAPGQPDRGNVLGWSLPNGLLVVGDVYDRNGRNLNEAVKAAMPAIFTTPPHPSLTNAVPVMTTERADTIFRGIEEAASEGAGIREGEREASIYVFFDPRCGHCKRLHEDLKNSDVLKTASITWMPVALFGDESEKLALFAMTGLDALDAAMKGKASEIPDSAMPKARAAIRANLMLLQLSGRASTPMVAWRDAQGRAHLDYGYTGTEQIKTMIESMQMR